MCGFFVKALVFGLALLLLYGTLCTPEAPCWLVMLSLLHLQCTTTCSPLVWNGAYSNCLATCVQSVNALAAPYMQQLVCAHNSPYEMQ